MYAYSECVALSYNRQLKTVKNTCLERFKGEEVHW